MFIPRRFVIGVDLDDTSVDLNGPFAAWHNEHFGTNVQYENITTFDLTQVYNIDFNTLMTRLDTFRTEHWLQMVPVVHDLTTSLPAAIHSLHILKPS
jgi:hypothetical protein